MTTPTRTAQGTAAATTTGQQINANPAGAAGAGRSSRAGVARILAANVPLPEKFCPDVDMESPIFAVRM